MYKSSIWILSTLAVGAVNIDFVSSTVAQAEMPNTRPSADWSGLTFKQFADAAIEAACSPAAAERKETPPEVVAFAWDHYLSREDQIRQADPQSMFKMLSAVLTSFRPSRRRSSPGPTTTGTSIGRATGAS